MRGNMEAEHSLLGCILLDARQVMPEAALALTVEDFQSEGCGVAFGLCLDLYRKGKPIDAITVTAGIEDREFVKFCIQAAEGTPTTRHYREYIRIVSESSRLCRAERITAELLGELQGGSGLTECQSMAGDLLQCFDEKHALDSMPAKEGFLSFIQNQEKKKEYIKTGIGWLDRAAHVDRGDYIVVGGRPSSGKTALTLQMALHMANKHKVVYFSLETKPEKIYERLICSYTQTNFTEIKRRDIPEQDWDRVVQRYDAFTKLRLDVVPAAGWTTEQIKSKAIQLQADVIFIDYLTLIHSQGKSLYEKATQISVDLHVMAQQRNVAVFALVQLNREGKGDPDMTSIRESGQIEQDADVIVLLNQPDEEDSGRELIIAKNKEGMTGKYDFFFDGAHQTFRAVDSRYDEDML